jgi:uncharacterized protein (DUF2267 family)
VHLDRVFTCLKIIIMIKPYFDSPNDFISPSRWSSNGMKARKKPASLNFERYAAEGNRFIKEVAQELGTDRSRAARITRAILHAIRDRLPANEAIEFAQGLPMALKGIFIDRYDISKTPIRIRDKRVFVEFIRRKAGQTAAIDFPGSKSVVTALHAFFSVLERNMSYGQVHQLKQLLNSELVDLIEDY